MANIVIPELAESITEGTIAQWLVKEGDYVEKGHPLIELETDKVNVEVTADYTGVITDIVRGEGEDVEVGDIVANMRQEEQSSSVDVQEALKSTCTKEASNQKDYGATTSPQVMTTKQAEGNDEPIMATPSARKWAREWGVDLREVAPSDPFGRIRKEDVARKYEQVQKPVERHTDEPIKQEQSKQQNAKPVQREKMSRRRMTIANRLVEAQQQTAMLTTFNEVDLTNVMQLRQERQEAFIHKHDVKLGFMSFFTKAVVGALKEFPLLNAEIQGNELVTKKFYDIGVAVSTEEGLVVPVVRDADRLDFAGIERDISRLSVKAREKQLTLNELQGGTFTITNGGTFGSMMSTPILNAPQVGILGMHNIQKRAMVMPDDSIQVRPMMYIALSYDHRIVDGKDAVQFLVRVKQMLEDPFDLLLEG
ncbi:2-oxoglutarate dehydrogenase complex dihydrolipoyllysine-residue succinyltransferase [Pontibacillus litoralis]|uniref:Dihydrolipoyllysine-residue succinyltransferase component of 2-oxoglutarate dehydrogenase complex n=1 Tax=Pontibacillus litoralis JSM 072002 TaxID=1385512 RepID=A0A0A5G436_9BACI|nr:2-oxoglutarate dehydrogenase complex dihydrolipoyllysine-residue succinyltransferase [Pontibacillus litoralis]KGX85850.1 dihydrolipoamide succinyltransferase [Pontibacillus litoralis JSM 072002]